MTCVVTPAILLFLMCSPVTAAKGIVRTKGKPDVAALASGKPDGRPNDSKTAANADTKKTKLSLTVYVQASFGDSGSVPILMRARGVAAKMFAAAGVQINWRTGLAKTSESEPILIDITSNTPEEFHRGALAYAQVFDGAHIRIFYDRVENAYRPGATAMLLAHVLVHEITHISEGIDRHSEDGVLKAQWTPDDLVQMVYSPLPFDPEDVLLIRQGLASRDRATRRTEPYLSRSICTLRAP